MLSFVVVFATRIQYHAYRQTCSLAHSMQPADKRLILKIDETRKDAHMFVTNVPFRELWDVVDVLVLLFTEKTPTRLPMMNMLGNEIDTSIQERYTALDIKHHTVEMDNNLLINRWPTNDIPFSLHTKQELRTLHRTTGYSAVRAWEMLLRCADGPKQLAKQQRYSGYTWDIAVYVNGCHQVHRELSWHSEDSNSCSNIVVK